MNDPYLQTVFDVTAEIMDVDPATLSSDMTLEEVAAGAEGEFDEILEVSAERLGLGFIGIYDTMPEGLSHDVISSL